MHSQPARRSKVGGPLWRDDHQQPGQVHLQTHLHQGTLPPSPSPPVLAPVIMTSLPSIQASYWSSKKYIVHGDVYDSDGVKVRHLFGTWHEALFCGEDPDSAQCVWRTGRSNFASKFVNFKYFGLLRFVFYVPLSELSSLQLPCLRIMRSTSALDSLPLS